MIYCVQFEDNEAIASARAENMKLHLAFLQKNKAAFLQAGPLIDTADGTGAGGLWVVEAETPEQVLGLIKEDPFWPTGLRKSFRIFEWPQVFSTVRRNV
ncbi:YciI family protein [Paraburkholderia tuberum]|uniref:YCII-related domain-containing protein n=1 Tax=Paraburkholderia tuberum TaxID=157910 RepID=A0A1H1JJ87_9BURK|nr:YciI family protein [Paraburkholderia tuberum]MBC8721074.1 hypothetical protein [Paraburkholderia sp. 31.1]SDR49497.1 hypothetical protein SAMN05445850_4872 [Paraburkholderia tuberum]